MKSLNYTLLLGLSLPLAAMPQTAFADARAMNAPIVLAQAEEEVDGETCDPAVEDCPEPAAEEDEGEADVEGEGEADALEAEPAPEEAPVEEPAEAEAAPEQPAEVEAAPEEAPEPEAEATDTPAEAEAEATGEIEEAPPAEEPAEMETEVKPEPAPEAEPAPQPEAAPEPEAAPAEAPAETGADAETGEQDEDRETLRRERRRDADEDRGEVRAQDAEEAPDAAIEAQSGDEARDERRRERRESLRERRGDDRQDAREERRDEPREERRETQRERGGEERQESRDDSREERRESLRERRGEDPRDAREERREDRQDAREDRGEDRRDARQERREERRAIREQRRDDTAEEEALREELETLRLEERGRADREERRRGFERRDDGRVIIREGDRITIRHDDRERLRIGADDYRVQRRDNGWTETVVVRADGVQVVTVTDPYGYVIERYRILPSGERYVLYANDPTWWESDQYRTYDPGLPPLVVHIPEAQYIVEPSAASPEQVREALVAEPVEEVSASYSLNQVLASDRLRDAMPRVDLDTITFEFNSAEVPDDQIDLLEEIGWALEDAIAENPNEIFLVEGHTDAVGSEEYNLELSDRRAESVAIILTDYFEIPPENLVTQGYGEQFLKIDTQAEERENRRVALRRITPLLDTPQVSEAR